MKKQLQKLSLSKKTVAKLKVSTVKGGVTGTTCEYTNRYFETCWFMCSRDAYVIVSEHTVNNIDSVNVCNE